MAEMNCSLSRPGGYGDFSRRVHARATAQRHPISGTIELTARCNLKCAHCYIDGSIAAAGEDREMSPRRLTGLVDQIVDAGSLWLLFTGGEPLLRPDFLDLYTYAKERGLLVTLFTNGTLVTPAVADHLARWRPFSVEISLYGRTCETYEAVTGTPGSYERCLRGISLLKDRGVPLRLKTTVLSLNRHELREMQRFAEDLDLPFRYDAMVSPRLTSSPEPLAVRLNPEQIVALDLEDPQRREEWERLAETFGKPVRAAGEPADLFRCGGGISAFAVDSSGRLGVCGFYRQEAWDLRDNSFTSGWEGLLGEMRRRKVTGHSRCGDCGIRAMCGMCPANGLLENNDPEQPVDFLCRVGHLRAYTLGLPLPHHGDCPYCRGGEGYEELMHSCENILQRCMVEEEVTA